jgi:hypothetical protein
MEEATETFAFSLDSHRLCHSDTRSTSIVRLKNFQAMPPQLVRLPSCNGLFGIVDVERPRPSTTYFEEIGGWHRYVLEPVIFDRRMTTFGKSGGATYPGKTVGLHCLIMEIGGDVPSVPEFPQLSVIGRKSDRRIADQPRE